MCNMNPKVSEGVGHFQDKLIQGGLDHYQQDYFSPSHVSVKLICQISFADKFDLKNEPIGHSKLKYNNEEVTVESDPSQSVFE